MTRLANSHTILYKKSLQIDDAIAGTINRKGVLIMKKLHIFIFNIIALTLVSVTCISQPVTAHTAVLKLNKTKLTVKINKKKSIKVKGAQRKKLHWKSSNANIVAVSSNGTVTGMKKGTATITVTAGKRHAKCKVMIIGKNDYSSVLTEKKVRKLLSVPKSTKITIKYGKTYYKKSFGATLVPVEVYEHGKEVAGASFLVKGGDLGCNIAQYGTYS